MLYAPFWAAITSLVTGLLLLRYIHLHQHFSGDPPSPGPQKFHLGKTPRIGGIPVFMGLLAGLIVLGLQHRVPWNISVLLMLSALPVFVAGLLEDITKRIKNFWRLIVSFISAGLGCWLLGTTLTRLNIWGIDSLIAAMPWLGVLFTVFAVGGLCHSLNLIDGYNGLAAGVGIIILTALGYVSFIVGDLQLLAYSLIVIGATAGFLFWNFPKGLIFAGDGGAYLLGFMIAEISVALVVRNPQVSPWFPFTLVMYPVWETLFTIYRRRVVRGQAAGLPDALHLHQMVFSRLVRWMVGAREAKNLRRRNSMTAPYLWGMGMLTIIPAVFFWEYPSILQLCCAFFMIFYVWLYQRIVRFRSPRWLVFHRE